MNIFNFWQNRNKVLGMNKRNLYYIRKYNLKKAKNIADDKVLSKKILTKSGIPTPKLVTVINNFQELHSFDWNSLPNSFVIKPVSGLEGGGIDIVYNRNQIGNWIRADKSQVSVSEIKQLSHDILNGRYSLHQEPDRILIEERVKNHKNFKYFAYKGTPDIRVIVFNNLPVMSYIRLPTIESKGKANLALGAIGANIDIATGTTTNAIKGKSGKIEFVPGTKLRLSGLKIPYWNKILKYAIEAQKATNLNFAAIDFLIDRDQGPLIVEINARPGLSIQLAADDGLEWRLKKARGLKISSVDKAIRLAKDLFGGEIETEIENISGKDLIGIYEKVTFFGLKNKEITSKAKIDTGADSTAIDTQLAYKLGFGDIIKALENENIPQDMSRDEAWEFTKMLTKKLVPLYTNLVDIVLIKSSHGLSIRPYINLKLKIQNTIIETKANIYDRSKLEFPAIIGRKSLSNFIIDPTKLS
jgi:alpha-L-glutamate ligase-like protein